MWARAMDTYNRVVLVVEPKKALLAEAQAELDVRKAILTTSETLQLSTQKETKKQIAKLTNQPLS